MMVKTLISLCCVLFLLTTACLAAEMKDEPVTAVMQDAKISTAVLQDAKISSAVLTAKGLPDLVVDSARVISDPIVITTAKSVMIPLEITVSNIGSGTATNFNVGGQANSKDGNAYGYWYVVPGEAEMEGRYGVLVPSLAAGSSVTFNGFMILVAQPVTAELEPGTLYKIDAMVDYNLDPDSSMYEWGVTESDETNNSLEVIYP